MTSATRRSGAAATAVPVLDISDLSVELSIGGRWIQALDRVGLTIQRGEVLGLVGESGSGKSLTALSIAGLLPGNARVAGGSIRLNGEEVLGKSEQALNRLRARSVALVFQNPTSYLNPVLTVGAQIAEIFELNPELLEAAGGGTRGREAWRQRILPPRVVRTLVPEPIVVRHPFELSAGMPRPLLTGLALVPP